MARVESRPPVQPGDRAPGFALPAVTHERLVSLDDYRGKSPVLVALFRGLYCAFCRWQITQLGTMQENLRAAGVETLAVVIAALERARLFFRYHPTRMMVLAAPDAAPHRAFGLPKIELTRPGLEAAAPAGPVVKVPEDEFLALRFNPMGGSPDPLPLDDAFRVVDEKLGGYEMTDTDDRIRAEHRLQTTGHFLLDRDGVVRWTHVEGQKRLADLGKFPTEEQLLAAARALPH